MSGANTIATSELKEQPGGRRGWNVAISQSPAIMAYVCERYGNGRLYAPSRTTPTALVDSYLHWHPNGTQQLIVQTFCEQGAT
jgi:glutathione S-transferase